MEFSEYLKMFKRRWWIVAALLGGAVASSLSATFLMVPLYETHAKIRIVTVGSNSEDFGFYSPTTLVENFGFHTPIKLVEEFQKPQVITMSARKAGLGDFKGKVQLQMETIPAANETKMITIIVMSSNAREASALANRLASDAGAFFDTENDPAYSFFLDETTENLTRAAARLKLAAQKAKKVLGKNNELFIPENALILSEDGWRELLELKIAKKEYFKFIGQLALMKNPVYLVKTIESAGIPSEPVSPRMSQNVLLAAVLGLFAGIGLVFIIEYWERIHPVSKTEK